MNRCVLASSDLAAAHRPALRGRGLFWRMIQGSPALRANPGLNHGIPLGFRRQSCESLDLFQNKVRIFQCRHLSDQV
jgi:hypothetical protein